MKSKMNKYLKYVAAAIFVATLAINIAITMDDPFVLLSDAMADETTTTSSSTTLWPCESNAILVNEINYDNGLVAYQHYDYGSSCSGEFGTCTVGEIFYSYTYINGTTIIETTDMTNLSFC